MSPTDKEYYVYKHMHKKYEMDIIMKLLNWEQIKG